MIIIDFNIEVSVFEKKTLRSKVALSSNQNFFKIDLFSKVAFPVHRF